MKTTTFENGRLLITRAAEERKPIIDRLNRIEGQVRGLRAMIENDRYCGDELQQIKAAIAALRRVALIISEQHIAAAAVRLSEESQRAAAASDIARILDEALKI